MKKDTLVIEVTEDEVKSVIGSNNDEFTNKIRNYPLYLSTSNLSAREIVMLAKLFEYDLDSVGNISIKFK